MVDDDVSEIDTYDDMNRLKLLTAKIGRQAIFDQGSFTYTADGQKTGLLEHRDGPNGAVTATTRMGWAYDADGRLTQEVRDEGDDNGGSPANQDGGDYTDTFTFDLNGNRLTKTHTAADAAKNTFTRSAYNPRDELTGTFDAAGVQQSAYTYDADGNTTSDIGPGHNVRYGWDLRNRLVAVDGNGDDLTIDAAGNSSGTINDASDSTYRYDENGVRVGKTTGGHTTAFLNDGQNPTGYAKPVEENVDGTLGRSYVIGSSVLAQADASGVTNLVRDGRQYARALVLNGVVVQSLDLDEFGSPQGNAQPSTSMVSPDGVYDSETGSYYQLAPYRTDGRFANEDRTYLAPADYNNSNLFNLDFGDPLNGTDPSGQWELPSLLFAMAIVGSIGIGLGVGLYAASLQHSLVPANLFR